MCHVRQGPAPGHLCPWSPSHGESSHHLDSEGQLQPGICKAIIKFHISECRNIHCSEAANEQTLAGTLTVMFTPTDYLP